MNAENCPDGDTSPAPEATSCALCSTFWMAFVNPSSAAYDALARPLTEFMLRNSCLGSQSGQQTQQTLALLAEHLERKQRRLLQELAVGQLGRQGGDINAIHGVQSRRHVFLQYGHV